MNGEELVLITASADPDLFEAAERSRTRRMWVVGEAAIDTDIPFDRVGTEWPL
jgi:hypothetical protein